MDSAAARPAPAPRLDPVPVAAAARAAEPARPPLSSFGAGSDRDRSMAMAYRAGYSLREVADYFGVSPSAVKRAANLHGV